MIDRIIDRLEREVEAPQELFGHIGMPYMREYILSVIYKYDQLMAYQIPTPNQLIWQQKNRKELEK